MIDVNEFAEKCFQDEAQAILNLIPNLTPDFSKAVDLVFNCKGRFIITGVGKSGHIGAKIAATLASTGTPSFFVNPLDAFHGDLGMIKTEDVIMAISYSGNTNELLRIIPFMLDRNIPIIGMSGNCSSLLAQFSTCHLNISVEHEACPLNLAPTSSTTVSLAMGDALACALMKLRNFRSDDFAKFHPGGSLGKRLLTNVGSVMRRDNLPIITPDTIISEALAVISDGRLGMAVVLTQGKLIGLVTDGDIRRAFQLYKQESFNIKVNDIMRKNPVCVYESDKLSVAENLFIEKRVHTLVVLDSKDEFLGFVDYRDCEN